MIQALGWLGSGLIVASLVHTRPVPFRLLNLASSIVLLVFNLAIGLWSMVVLNSVILIVNLWHLRALAGRRRSPAPSKSPRATSRLNSASNVFGKATSSPWAHDPHKKRHPDQSPDRSSTSEEHQLSM